jgi:hypothetical protein
MDPYKAKVGDEVDERSLTRDQLADVLEKLERRGLKLRRFGTSEHLLIVSPLERRYADTPQGRAEHLAFHGLPPDSLAWG